MNTSKRSTALLRHIRKLREMAPQMIEPLDSSLPKDVCLWLEKVFKAWKKESTLYDLKRLSIPGLSDKQFHIYQLKNARYGSSKYNFIFQMKEEKCIMFSKYIVKKMKGLPTDTVTQCLLWRDKAVSRNSNIPSNIITTKVIFPMTGGLLCDTQQTDNGRNAWEYIVQRLGYDSGNLVGVYDNQVKKFIEIPTQEEYDETTDQYYSTDSSSKRYQIAIIRK